MGCVPVNEDFLEAGVDEVGHQGAVVSADCLYPLTVHLIMHVCTGREVKACIALLIDQQVREVHLQERKTREPLETYCPKLAKLYSHNSIVDLYKSRKSVCMWLGGLYLLKF